MEGPPCPDEQSEGMIPRALRQVFAAAQDLSGKGWAVCKYIYVCFKLVHVKVSLHQDPVPLNCLKES